MKRGFFKSTAIIAAMTMALSGCTDYSEYTTVTPLEKKENATSNEYVTLTEQKETEDVDKTDNPRKKYIYDGLVRVELVETGNEDNSEISIMFTNGLDTELVSFGMPIARNENSRVELNWHGNSLQSVFVVAPHQSLIATYSIPPDYNYKGCTINGRVWANISENEDALTRGYTLTI